MYQQPCFLPESTVLGVVYDAAIAHNVRVLPSRRWEFVEFFRKLKSGEKVSNFEYMRLYNLCHHVPPSQEGPMRVLYKEGFLLLAEQALKGMTTSEDSPVVSLEKSLLRYLKSSRTFIKLFVKSGYFQRYLAADVSEVFFQTFNAVPGAVVRFARCLASVCNAAPPGKEGEAWLLQYLDAEPWKKLCTGNEMVGIVRGMVRHLMRICMGKEPAMGRIAIRALVHDNAPFSRLLREYADPFALVYRHITLHPKAYALLLDEATFRVEWKWNPVYEWNWTLATSPSQKAHLLLKRMNVSSVQLKPCIELFTALCVGKCGTNSQSLLRYLPMDVLRKAHDYHCRCLVTGGGAI